MPYKLVASSKTCVRGIFHRSPPEGLDNSSWWGLQALGEKKSFNLSLLQSNGHSQPFGRVKAKTSKQKVLFVWSPVFGWRFFRWNHSEKDSITEAMHHLSFLCKKGSIADIFPREAGFLLFSASYKAISKTGQLTHAGPHATKVWAMDDSESELPADYVRGFPWAPNDSGFGKTEELRHWNGKTANVEKDEFWSSGIMFLLFLVEYLESVSKPSKLGVTQFNTLSDACVRIHYDHKIVPDITAGFVGQRALQ